MWTAGRRSSTHTRQLAPPFVAVRQFTSSRVRQPQPRANTKREGRRAISILSLGDPRIDPLQRFTGENGK
eukprot:scaffold1166_cov261-Pinguiococcus_pyrenoidosus.AAC.10